jgi:hypothetical protein
VKNEPVRFSSARAIRRTSRPHLSLSHSSKKPLSKLMDRLTVETGILCLLGYDQSP